MSIRNLIAAAAKPDIYQTYDQALVERIVADSAIYPDISDDGSPPAHEFEAQYADSLTTYLTDGVGRLYVYTQYNAVTWEVHACVLPEYQGNSIDYARVSLAWMFDNTACQKVVAKIPDFNKRAIAYARKAGFKVEGLMTKAYLKNNKLHDMCLLGVSCP